MARKRRILSDRTQAVLAAELLAGAKCRDAAKRAGVGLGTAGRASKTLGAQIIADSRQRIGDLLLEMVGEIVTANVALAKLLADPDYARQHRPNELAILGGTLLDKAFLVLAAAERAQLGNPDGGFGSMALTSKSAPDVQAPTLADPDSGSREGGGDTGGPGDLHHAASAREDGDGL